MLKVLKTFPFLSSWLSPFSLRNAAIVPLSDGYALPIHSFKITTMWHNTFVPSFPPLHPHFGKLAGISFRDILYCKHMKNWRKNYRENRSHQLLFAMLLTFGELSQNCVKNFMEFCLKFLKKSEKILKKFWAHLKNIFTKFDVQYCAKCIICITKMTTCTLRFKIKKKFYLIVDVAGKSSFIVFMTDYETYAGIYSCQRVGFTHRESATILSRKNTLDKAYIDKVSTYSLIIKQSLSIRKK